MPIPSHCSPHRAGDSIRKWAGGGSCCKHDSCYSNRFSTISDRIVISNTPREATRSQHGVCEQDLVIAMCSQLEPRATVKVVLDLFCLKMLTKY